MDVIGLVIGVLGTVVGVIGWLTARTHYRTQMKIQEESFARIQADLQRQRDNLTEELRRLGIDHVCLPKQFEMAHELAKKLKDNGWGNPAVILALSSGGEMIANWLSRRYLGNGHKPIPVYTIAVSVTMKTVNGKKVGDKALVNKNTILNLEDLERGAKVLLVTDIVRSGTRLKEAKDYLMGLQQFRNGRAVLATAALVKMEMCDPPHSPDHFYHETKQYVQFDWKDEKVSPQGLSCGNHCPLVEL